MRYRDLFKKSGPGIKDSVTLVAELVKTDEYKEAVSRPSTIVKRKKHQPRKR